MLIAITYRENRLQDGEPRVRVEIHPLDVTDKHGNIDESINAIADQSISPAEASPVQNFLSGKNCLHGASTPRNVIRLLYFRRMYF